MDPLYVEQYAQLYRQHWWWRARESFLVSHLQKLRLPGAPPAILDIGCASGLFFDKLNCFGRVTGVEPDLGFIAGAGRWANRIHNCPFDATFLPAERFSLILLLDVLEHMRDPTAALAHARRLLLPGGYIVITVPAFRALWTAHDTLNRHYNRYDIGSLGSLAQTVRLEVVDARYFFHWLFAVKMLLHGVERVASPQPKPPRVPPDWLNRMLLAISMMEMTVTRRLRRAPGSSLFAVLACGEVETE